MSPTCCPGVNTLGRRIIREHGWLSHKITVILQILGAWKFRWRAIAECSVSFKFRCGWVLLWSLNVLFAFRCLFNFGKTLDPGRKYWNKTTPKICKVTVIEERWLMNISECWSFNSALRNSIRNSRKCGSPWVLQYFRLLTLCVQFAKKYSR